MSSQNISIVGAPFNGGQPKAGVEAAPKELREAGLQASLEKAGWKVTYNADVPVREIDAENDTHPGAKRPRYVGRFCEELCATVAERARAGDFVLTVGGDHSVAAGSIAGVLTVRPETVIIWVDAHADINSPATSDSGNIHGMPVALLAKLCGNVPGFEYLEKAPTLNLQNIIYIALRDVDSGEKKVLTDNKITAFHMPDVERLGIKEVVRQALEKAGTRPIHLSFDIDGIDPKYMPATGTPVHAGISLDDGIYICKQLAATRRVVSFDLVEVNLALGTSAEDKKTTLANSIKLAEGLLSPVWEPSK